jgi:hypothetical protein
VLIRDIHLMATPVPAELSARGGLAIKELLIGRAE